MTANERLSLAIEQLTIELHRYNDFIQPVLKKREEAEYGRANYEDAEKKEIASQLTAHLTSQDSALNRPKRRGTKKVRDNG